MSAAAEDYLSNRYTVTLPINANVPQIVQFLNALKPMIIEGEEAYDLAIAAGWQVEQTNPNT
jgi:hypothetical protein